MKCFFLLFLSLAAAFAEEPFWRAKEKVYRKMLEDRVVVVSVVSRESPSPQVLTQSLSIQGAGVVEAPPPFTFEKARRFEDFPKMSEYIKVAHFTPTREELLLQTEAYGYEAKMKFKIEFVEKEPKEIRFSAIEGVFKGMQGHIRVEDLQRRRSLISMTAQYQFDKLPIPKFFVEFGIEVVLRIMATKMRSFVETQWRDGAGHGKKAKSP